jgi:hypothetical protein
MLEKPIQLISLMKEKEGEKSRLGGDLQLVQPGLD